MTGGLAEASFIHSDDLTFLKYFFFYLDVTHNTLDVCVDSYNSCLDVLMEVTSQEPERYRIIVATHNEESVRRAAKR